MSKCFQFIRILEISVIFFSGRSAGQITFGKFKQWKTCKICLNFLTVRRAQVKMLKALNKIVYIIAQVIFAFSLALVYDLLEDRRKIGVIITKFSLGVKKMAESLRI